MINFIEPNWPKPKNIKAYSTTREGGLSQPPYDKLNLAVHVDDDPTVVLANRALLKKELQLPNEPIWLMQQHDNLVIHADAPSTIDADGSYTNQTNIICAILTADCLPILLCNKQGTEIAALHGGWKGLAKGIIEKGLQEFSSQPQDVLAWLGPAIGPEIFEVGQEIYDTFLKNFPELEQNNLFKPSKNGRWLLNLYQLARQQLAYLGVEKIYGGDFCNYSDPERFYSYRRNKETGRMASLIWIEES